MIGDTLLYSGVYLAVISILAICLTLYDKNAAQYGLWRIKERTMLIVSVIGGSIAMLKCDPIKADILRQVFKDAIPAYHMDKRHWITVITGGDVSKQELYDMILESYDLIKPKLRTQNRMIADKDKLWPNNLYYEVLGKDYGCIPGNAEEAIEYVLNTLHKREKAIVLARFRDYMTFVSIGDQHGISDSRVQQIKSKAIRKMRHPSRSRFLINLTEQLECDI